MPGEPEKVPGETQLGGPPNQPPSDRNGIPEPAGETTCRSACKERTSQGLAHLLCNWRRPGRAQGVPQDSNQVHGLWPFPAKGLCLGSLCMHLPQLLRLSGIVWVELIGIIWARGRSLGGSVDTCRWVDEWKAEILGESELGASGTWVCFFWVFAGYVCVGALSKAKNMVGVRAFSMRRIEHPPSEFWGGKLVSGRCCSYSIEFRLGPWGNRWFQESVGLIWVLPCRSAAVHQLSFFHKQRRSVIRESERSTLRRVSIDLARKGSMLTLASIALDPDSWMILIHMAQSVIGGCLWLAEYKNCTKPRQLLVYLTETKTITLTMYKRQVVFHLLKKYLGLGGFES